MYCIGLYVYNFVSCYSVANEVSFEPNFVTQRVPKGLKFSFF